MKTSKSEIIGGYAVKGSGAGHNQKYIRGQVAAILSVSLLLGLVFDLLFYGKMPGISVFLYSSLILGLTLYLAQRFKRPLNVAVYGLIPVMLFFALMVFVRASAALAALNILLIVYLLLVVGRLAANPAKKLSQYELTDYLTVIRPQSPGYLRKLLATILTKTINDRSGIAEKSSYLPIVRGLIISLPILTLFFLLLSSADLVFKKYVGSLFDFSIAGETIFRWGLFGFVSSLFISAYALIFMRGYMPQATPGQPSKKFSLGSTEASIILGSVCLLFFVFVIVQLAYLFGGSGQIESTGYTYAEYARKGFFELIAVAVISLLLIWSIKKHTNLRNLGQAMTFKWLGGTLVAEVMVIMLSAHMRLNLYEQVYGFTSLRLLSHLFILWLAIAFILLLIHIFREKGESRFAFQLFASLIGFFALINLINLDAFIARQNINRFNDTGKLDTAYLSSLSRDAVPTVAGFLDHPNDKVRNSAAGILYAQKQSSAYRSNHWQSANLARQRAERIFRDNAVEIEAGKSSAYYQQFESH